MKDNGFTVLGNELHRNMQNIVGANSSDPLEFGKINSDMSLQTDNFQRPIPKGDYMVNILLTSNHGLTISGEDNGESSNSYTVESHILKAGDRVLVAKVGKERIVIAVVTSSNNI